MVSLQLQLKFITHDNSFDACNSSTVAIVAIVLYEKIRQMNKSPYKCKLMVPAFVRYLFW